MTLKNNQKILSRYGHKVLFLVILCLFGLSVLGQSQKVTKKKERPKTDERIYLVHADRLRFDQYGNNPTAQVLNGNVEFSHKGARLLCDSAYFYQESNSLRAFSNVKMYQGDTLSLFSDYAYYDGNEQMAESRFNVILTHRQTKLYTDSLNYDRLYGIGYFFEGGKMIDKDNILVSDWGEYDTETRESVFYYDVNLKNPKYVMNTDTLYYDTNTSVAHVLGPSEIVSDNNIIHTIDGYYDTDHDKARLYQRSTLENEGKEITGDSLFYDEITGISEGFNNVVYVDKENKNELNSEYLWYNELTGTALATDSALMKDFSQNDTLYMHSDTMRVFTFNINTDSVFRKVHCYNKVRAYRTDVQAVCDSLVYNTKDSCMTMYIDPITWSDNRQLLGEIIEIYMNDSTIDHSHVIRQALSVEKIPKTDYFNQISSRDMYGYFENGEIHRTDAIGNVIAAYYIEEDKDSSYVNMVYIETDTMRMYMENRQLQKIWACKNIGTMYPVTQVPPDKAKLPSFVWFDYVRPLDKDDIFYWRGKKSGTELKNIQRHSAPLQYISSGGVVTGTDEDAQIKEIIAQQKILETLNAQVNDSLISQSSDSLGVQSSDSLSVQSSDSLSIQSSDSLSVQSPESMEKPTVEVEGDFLQGKDEKVAVASDMPEPVESGDKQTPETEEEAIETENEQQ